MQRDFTRNVGQRRFVSKENQIQSDYFFVNPGAAHIFRASAVGLSFACKVRDERRDVMTRFSLRSLPNRFFMLKI